MQNYTRASVVRQRGDVAADLLRKSPEIIEILDNEQYGKEALENILLLTNEFIWFVLHRKHLGGSQLQQTR